MTTTKKAPRKKTSQSKPSAPKTAASKSASKSTAAKRSRKHSPGELASAKREVIYPDVSTELAQPLTADKAKALLGWQEESENVKFKDEYTFRLPGDDGGKIRCTNNIANRHLSLGVVDVYKQEILRGKWRLNGETIVIGRTGLILDGQHTLIAVVLAAMEWEASQGKWADTWKTEPTIDRLVVFGIAEDDDTVNTIDTGRPRTLADVIFRSQYFQDVDKRDRVKLARMLDHAIRLTWSRTGAGSDAFAPKRTHAESLDFLNRHQRLIEAVKHVYEENGTTNSIGKWLSPGYASGLLYLMAASDTDEDGQYSVVAQPTEELVDFKLWDKACEFFVLLAAGDVKLDVVRQALAAMIEEDGGSLAERLALLIKAWGLFSTRKKITTEGVALEYTKDEDGFPILTDSPCLGGIDLGDPV